MVTVHKSDLKYKSLEENVTTVTGSSHLYSWILGCVLFIIGLSFFLIAFSLENLYSLNDDFETLDPTILMSLGINKSRETPLYAKRAMAYLQTTHKYRKNSYRAVEFHSLPPNTSSLVVVDNFQLFCYYSLPHSNSSDLTPTQVNPHLCTHILLAFTEVSNNFTLVPCNTNHPQIFKEVVALKKINPSLKVLVSVIDGGTGNFAKAIATRNTRVTFAANILEFLIEHRLDGVDLDWEFPGWPAPARTDEKRLFRKLMQQLKYTLSGQFNVPIMFLSCVYPPSSSSTRCPVNSCSP
uniref:Chitotriosidase-1 n=1 Tax=Cacopsylla melanoneura TaxID=428564 RepID=A0A8D8UJE3_9HEMI